METADLLNQEKSGASDRNFGSSSRFLPCSEPRLLFSSLPSHREREPSSCPASEAVASCDSEQVQPLLSGGLGSSRRRRRALLLFLPPRLQRQRAAGLVEKAEAEEAEEEEKGGRRGEENGSSRGTRSTTSNREQQGR